MVGVSTSKEKEKILNAKIACEFIVYVPSYGRKLNYFPRLYVYAEYLIRDKINNTLNVLLININFQFFYIEDVCLV